MTLTITPLATATPATVPGASPVTETQPGASAPADFLALIATLRTQGKDGMAGDTMPDIATKLMQKLGGEAGVTAIDGLPSTGDGTTDDGKSIDDVLAGLLAKLDVLTATPDVQAAPVDAATNAVPVVTAGSGMTDLLASVSRLVTRSKSDLLSGSRSAATAPGISGAMTPAPAPSLPQVATMQAPSMQQAATTQAPQNTVATAFANLATMLGVPMESGAITPDGTASAPTTGGSTPPAAAAIGDPDALVRLAGLLDGLPGDTAPVPASQLAAMTSGATPAAGLPASASPQGPALQAQASASPASVIETGPAATSEVRDPAQNALLAAVAPPVAPAAAGTASTDLISGSEGVQDAAPAPADIAIKQHLDLARDSEWLDALARDISRMAARDGQLNFQLNPEHLGSLKVELANNANGTSIRLTADTEAARAILVDAQPKLLAEARAQGLRVSDAQVDLGGQGNARQQEQTPVVVVRTDRQTATAHVELEQVGTARADERYA